LKKLKILVCALETSSNLHLKELQKHLPSNVEFIGIFDKSLGNPAYDISQMAVMGFVDALKKLPFFLKLKKQMVELAAEADKILLMDNSGFNLPLAKDIRKKYPNKEIIYYILPQAWAWKKKRIPVIENTCDKLCSILPFEKDYYNLKEKISYVGHPLLDEIKVFKEEESSNDLVAFMPGSRKSEIVKLMPVYRELSKKLSKKSILIIPAHFSKEYIRTTYGDTSNFIISNNTYESLVKADFAFICSGTATLEAAIIGTPFILSYIAKPLDYFIAKKFLKLNYIGLANIFFEQMGKEPIHKEFLQDEVTAHNLYNSYQNINTKNFLLNSIVLRNYLSNGSSKNVADILIQE